MATLIALTVPTTIAATSTTTQMRHSQNVIRFFDNHGWLRAPNQPNCVSVPWTRSCRIARRIYIHHTNKLERLQHAAWVDYHYNWRSWLPANWKAVGTCETGYGGDPNFKFANGSFVSAFGISRSIYDTDARMSGTPPWNDANPPTPRQQYLAAAAHYQHFGDGWGCPGP